jgi:hypothetical protein
MNTKYLLRVIEGKKEVKIQQEIIINIPEFQTGYEKDSFESALLVVNGHQAIKTYRFDESKLKKWCEVNNLIYYIDERDQIVHLKLKS